MFSGKSQFGMTIQFFINEETKKLFRFLEC